MLRSQKRQEKFFRDLTAFTSGVSVPKRFIVKEKRKISQIESRRRRPLQIQLAHVLHDLQQLVRSKLAPLVCDTVRQLID